jgi:hypothetical protein
MGKQFAVSIITLIARTHHLTGLRERVETRIPQLIASHLLELITIDLWELIAHWLVGAHPFWGNITIRSRKLTSLGERATGPREARLILQVDRLKQSECQATVGGLSQTT